MQKPDISIDDAAAFLIQIEPNDLSELARLKEMLDPIAVNESYSETSRKDILKAVELIEGIIVKNISYTDCAINEIGNLVESAINANDTNGTGRRNDPGTVCFSDLNDERDADDPLSNQFPDDEFAVLVDEFIAEGNDLIAGAEEALLKLENNSEDLDSLDTVFRAFHSIKGSSALLRFDVINELTHHVETILSCMRNREIQCADGYADLLFRSLDMLKELFQIVNHSSEGRSISKPAGWDELMGLLADPTDMGDNEVMGMVCEESSSVQPDEQHIFDQQDYMPKDNDFVLIEEFITEGVDLIATAEEALLVLESRPEDSSAIDMAFRAFHTIKGTSAFLDLTLLTDMGHHAETLLSRVRNREIRYAGGYADLALRSLDMLKELIMDVELALGGESLCKPEGYDELVNILKNPEKSGVSEESIYDPLPRIGDILVSQEKIQRDDVEKASSPRIGDILVAQGKIERDRVEEIAANQDDKPIGISLLKKNAASITDVGQALRIQARIKGAKQQPVQASVRVATDRLDRLIDMVGELVIAYSMVTEDDIVAISKDHEFQKKVSHANKIVRELQNMTMSLRMVPLKGTFNKMSRLVRDVSRKVGKKVKFVIEGEDTEIDRNMADAIKDPLVHMVRNAVDHGIELPDERESMGKPIEGSVKLSAYHSAGSVIVEIEDDGRGLDREMILTKSIERGLTSDAVALSDREVFNMIFEPGFSTAETITDVSGRGVGMDVVKRNIDAIRGQTEIHSEPGRGSIFQMRLPLTLAIIDGMVIRVGHETYVIPTLSIVRSIKPESEDISTVLDQGEMLFLQGELIPLFRVGDIFHVDGVEIKKEIELVVVVEDDGKLAGLAIDELIGSQQVVIKALGETMRDIPGISGGAIMPNGRVGLIIDVGGVVRFANNRTGRRKARAVA
ncbi:MAG: chemotaxis protein CheA [Deltaproteobacteria bacterium]|nr:chemotaxis protein CheA [Deltaproteobacteria bacterium]